MPDLNRKVIITENREGSLTFIYQGIRPEDNWKAVYLYPGSNGHMVHDEFSVRPDEVEEYVREECDQEKIIYNTSGIHLGNGDVNL